MTFHDFFNKHRFGPLWDPHPTGSEPGSINWSDVVRAKMVSLWTATSIAFATAIFEGQNWIRSYVTAKTGCEVLGAFVAVLLVQWMRNNQVVPPAAGVVSDQPSVVSKTDHIKTTDRSQLITDH